MANVNDLRYKRTEEAIRRAFMELISNAPLSSVTASALCKRANISRNAFYLHHSSVTELYGALVGELVADVRNESVASADKRFATGSDDAFDKSILEALARHEALMRALLPVDDGSLAKCLAEGIEAAYVEAALRFGEHGGSFEHRVSCAFSAWGVVGFVSRWIEKTDRPLSDGRELFEALQGKLSSLGADYLMSTK